MAFLREMPSSSLLAMNFHRAVFVVGSVLKSGTVYGLSVPSVLWRCWFGGKKGIRPVKTEWWGASMVVCLEWGADLHMAQLMPLPLTVSCFSKIQIGFTFLVPAHPSSPGIRAAKRVCVCVCVYGLCEILTFLSDAFWLVWVLSLSWTVLH